MFRRKEKPNVDLPIPERARYTKYYEHDGQLRAYANRSMLMAGLFGVIALVSLGFAIYVRLQPTTVIRVSADGEATVVGGRPASSTPALTRAGLPPWYRKPRFEVTLLLTILAGLLFSVCWGLWDLWQKRTDAGLWEKAIQSVKHRVKTTTSVAALAGIELALVTWLQP